MKKILNVQSDEILQPFFLSGLRDASGCQILAASPASEALRLFANNGASVVLVIVTLGPDPEDGVRFLREVRRCSDQLMVDWPRFLVLSPYSLTQRNRGCLKRLRSLGARCILRSSDEAIYEEVRQIMTEMEPNNSWPTIRLRPTQHGVIVTVDGYAKSSRWVLGPRLQKKLILHANRPEKVFSTRELAEALGISEPSVKSYRQQLRDSFDEIRVELGIQMTGEEVFWTERRAGGFIHGICANIIWERQ